MIAKASVRRQAALRQFLEADAALNIFIIGDMENFGFDKPYQDIWAESIGGQYKAVLLRYFSSFVFYAPADCNMAGFVKIIEKSTHLKTLSGQQDTLLPFSKAMSFSRIRQLYMAQLDLVSFRPAAHPRLRVQRARMEDAERIYTLRSTAIEFADTLETVKGVAHTLETKSGRIYFIKDKDTFVCSAASTAENSASAMLVGVVTHKAYRKRGYATVCVSALCSDLLDEGKTVCLFYENPAAARIYKRLGFRDIDRWMICVK